MAGHKSLWLGIPVVVMTAVVGTSIFGTLTATPNIYVKIAAGLLSISAAVLAALQTYLGYGEKSAKHKEAGAKYAAIWRSLDLLDLELKNAGEAFSDSAIEQLKKIVSQLDEAAKASPSLPDGVYEKASGELRTKLAERTR